MHIGLLSQRREGVQTCKSDKRKSIVKSSKRKSSIMQTDECDFAVENLSEETAEQNSNNVILSTEENEITLSGIGFLFVSLEEPTTVSYRVVPKENENHSCGESIFYLPLDNYENGSGVDERLQSVLNELWRSKKSNICFRSQQHLTMLMNTLGIDASRVDGIPLLSQMIDPLVAAWLTNPEEKDFHFDSLISKMNLPLPEQKTISLTDDRHLEKQSRIEPLAMFASDLKLCLILMTKMDESLQLNYLMSPFINQEMSLVPILTKMQIFGIGLVFASYLIKSNVSAYRTQDLTESFS